MDPVEPPRRAMAVWLVPALTTAAAAILLISAHWELREVRSDARRSFESQVEVITRLVHGSARQAAHAIDLAYDHAEEELAHLACQTDRPAPGWVRVAVSGPPAGPLEGQWGTVPEGARGALTREVLAAPRGEIVDGGTPLAQGLYCLHERCAEAARVVCGDLGELSRRRREVGLGRLLQDLAGKDLAYVALQDEGGILARTPGSPLSGVGQDAFLAQAAAGAGTRFRRSGADGRPVLEGATALKLPDGSSALLRVGVDASGLERVERRIASRELGHLLLTGLLLLASIAIALVLRSRQRQEMVARQLRQEREEAQRQWQAIGQMAATVAHEVRAPLNTISMATQRLRKEFTLPEPEREEHKELLGLVGEEAERLDRVVKDFLELGRPLVLRPERVDLREVMLKALAPIELRAAQAGRKLQIEVPSLQVSLDPQRFGQLIANLAGNALDAVAGGGSVKVEAGVTDGALRVTIEDDGPGMTAEMLAQAQQPFVSTKAHGTGLGLPLAKRLAEAMGGALLLQSSPGQGTRAEVSAPLEGKSDDRK